MTETRDLVLDEIRNLRTDISEVREHVTAEVHRLELAWERAANEIRGQVGTLLYRVDGMSEAYQGMSAAVKQVQDLMERDRKEFREDLTGIASALRAEVKLVDDRVDRITVMLERGEGEKAGASNFRTTMQWVFGIILAMAAIYGFIEAVSSGV